eukprot:TRINITY_DN5455_c0_g1_i1.p4 TRINITY_DN5455_c0_g1~~TRINITY_DN5455_c0_g1_i1.p4  ORF type:complete len:146 (-),score=23.81 TRINITY_DN5455_c0_g1_i1:42-479(-)
MAMFGTDMIGQHWGDVARAHLEPTLTVGEWLIGDGRVSIAESALPSAGGKILLIHDVTAAHRMKTELERNQRLAAMGEMAASLAHQLRKERKKKKKKKKELGVETLFFIKNRKSQKKKVVNKMRREIYEQKKKKYNKNKKKQKKR